MSVVEPIPVSCGRSGVVICEGVAAMSAVIGSSPELLTGAPTLLSRCYARVTDQ
jgi:hypothetical protein